MVKHIKFFSPDMRIDSSGTLLIDGVEIPYQQIKITGTIDKAATEPKFISVQIEITTKQENEN